MKAPSTPQPLPQVDSSQDPPNSHLQAPSTLPAAQPPSPPQQAGNIPQASAAPLSVLVVNRGPGGKWAPTGGRRQVEEEKGQIAPESPADGGKSEVTSDLRGIQGLDSIPKSWPQLPGNVSIGLDVAWVQANRLLVVKETSSGRIKVDLSKARTPAPSMGTLFWLETAIKNPAKFVEVAAKQASSGQDEAEFVRRERMQIAEIRALLEEMRQAK